MKPRWIFAIGAFVLLVGARPLHAQWSTDPTVNNPICTATSSQWHPIIVSDGAGGNIITWTDYRNGSYPNNSDIYAQRINASGVVQWTTDGVAICTATNSQFSTGIVSDGAGGAIITWQDSRNGNWDLYAQRIDASGVVQWTANGVAICTAMNDQGSAMIVSDGVGGAIMTWQDHRSSTPDIYTQRINASGIGQWTVDGVAICTATNWQSSPTMVSDGAGGAIITWTDSRSSTHDIYAQRINASGVVQWTTNGVAICTATNYQVVRTIISDGAGGAIITWDDARVGVGSYYDTYAQRINASGIVQWTADGVAICTATNNQYRPKIVSDGAGGAIITWQDERSGSSYWDIYAQWINASGVVRWPTNGVAICTATNHQEAPTIASDGAGGAIISWTDRRGGYSDIYAQRINASGVVQWAIDGVAICTAMNTQSDPDIVSDGAGGAIITWIDYRTDNTGSSVDIYAQRVRSGGTLGDNSAPFAAAGTAQTVIINEAVQLDGSGSNDPDNNSLTFAWTITLKPAGSNAALSNPASVTPTFVADVAGEYKVRLIVNDGTVNSAPDEALITAITAQDATQSLIDQVLALNKPQGNGLINGKLEVAIKRLDNNDIDGAIAKLQEFIDQVEVFIGNGTFTAEEGLPLIDAANEIIDALQASLPKLAQTIASPTEYRLEQNSPNPFNPSTTISFTLPEANEVSLAIYSLSGQLVKRLVAGEMSAGNHSMVWDATDDRGERVASGVYVFVLKAGEFTARRKLVLMK